MRTKIVIRRNSFPYGSLCGPVIGKCPVQEKLCLENTIDPFSNGIVIGITAFPHTDLTVVCSQQLGVVVAAILNPTVRVMNQLGSVRYTGQCHFQRSQGTIQRQALTHVKSYDLARVHIRHQCQITKPFVQSHISNIRNKNSIRRIHSQFLDQVGIDPEPVMRVRRHCISLTSSHQQPVFPQKIKEPVSAHRTRDLLHIVSKHPIQLSSTHHRHLAAYLVYHLQDQMLFHLFIFCLLAMLIHRLTSNVEQSANLSHRVASFTVLGTLTDALYDLVTIFFLSPDPYFSSITSMVDSNAMIFNCACAKADSNARFSRSNAFSLSCSPFISILTTVWSI